jgi:hypothetical protein
VNSGLAAVQIGTALLVKVRVFRCLVWVAYSLKCWTAWTVKLEAVISCEIWYLYTGQHGEISEQTSMFSSFYLNNLEYYRNILCLIIINRNFSPSNLRALMYVNNVSTNSTYINISHQNTFQNILAASLQLSLLTFHIHLTFLSSHHSPISSLATFCLKCSTSLSTFQLCFKISLLFCFVCRATRELFNSFTELQNLTTISNVPPSGHVKCQHAMCTHSHGDWTNVQLTSYDSA